MSTVGFIRKDVNRTARLPKVWLLLRCAFVVGPNLFLALLDAAPELVINNSQVRDGGGLDLVCGIAARDPPPRLWILDVPLPVPNQSADVEFVVENTRSALSMAAYCAVTPQPCSRRRYTIPV